MNLVAKVVSHLSVVGSFVYAQPSWPEGVLKARKWPTLMVSPLGATGGVGVGVPGVLPPALPPLLWTGGTA